MADAGENGALDRPTRAPTPASHHRVAPGAGAVWRAARTPPGPLRDRPPPPANRIRPRSRGPSPRPAGQDPKALGPGAGRTGVAQIVGRGGGPTRGAEP